MRRQHPGALQWSLRLRPPRSWLTRSFARSNSGCGSPTPRSPVRRRCCGVTCSPTGRVAAQGAGWRGSTATASSVGSLRPSAQWCSATNCTPTPAISSRPRPRGTAGGPGAGSDGYGARDVVLLAEAGQGPAGQWAPGPAHSVAGVHGRRVASISATPASMREAPPSARWRSWVGS